MKYITYHLWIHALGNSYFCRDDTDKFEFIRILAGTCLDYCVPFVKTRISESKCA